MEKSSHELIMFYNVENLFLAEQKQRYSAGFSSGMPKNWNYRKYENKIHKIAHVFEIVEQERGQVPFLIGLSEIQGRKPLEDLVKLPPFNDEYGIVHYESMDERGVDVALLYDRSKIEMVSSEPISFFFEIEDKNPANYDTTRDVLLCTAKYGEDILNIFVFHLPSKRENDVNKPKRDYILKEIKERITDLAFKKGEAVVLCGDFNENPDDENLKNILALEDGSVMLQNPFLDLFSNKIYSTFHYANGLLFDQIILSNHFFDQKFSLNFVSAEVFRPQKIANWDRKMLGRPFRTYAGTRYLGGYSDHFPVIIKLKKHIKKINDEERNAQRIPPGFG